MLKIPQVALDASDARRLRLVASELVTLESVLGGQAVKAPAPATPAIGPIGTPSAALEVRRKTRAFARVLDQAEILLRRPKAYGNLVEGVALGRLVEHPPRDLERFARFTRCREEPHVAHARRLGWWIECE